MSECHCQLEPKIQTLIYFRRSSAQRAGRLEVRKLLSLTYKVLTTHQPQYLHDSISVQPCHNKRFSSMVTLARPPTRSSLKITNRSFRYVAPCLWNELPTDLREPRQTVSCTFSYHTWQLIIFTTVTITACIFSYSLSVSI